MGSAFPRDRISVEKCRIFSEGGLAATGERKTVIAFPCELSGALSVHVNIEGHVDSELVSIGYSEYLG
jgi:hypothetical protein